MGVGGDGGGGTRQRRVGVDVLAGLYTLYVCDYTCVNTIITVAGAMSQNRGIYTCIV